MLIITGIVILISGGGEKGKDGKEKSVMGVTWNDSEISIFAPMVRGRKGEYYQMLYDIYNSGYLEVRVDGKLYSLKERIILEKNNKHTIEVVVDRLVYGLQSTDYSSMSKK